MFTKINILKFFLTLIIFAILSWGSLIPADNNEISFLAGIYVGRLIFAGVLVFGFSKLINK